MLNNGYAFYGDVWALSPEKALKKAAEQDHETMQTLTPKIMLKHSNFDDIVVMTFLSKNDTLVTVTFVSNEDNLYSVSGWTEEWDLDNPSEFLINGDPNQFILFPYQKHNNVVYGWCYTNAQFSVNGISPARETFSFDVGEKTYSIDFWMVDEYISDEDISIQYFSD